MEKVLDSGANHLWGIVGRDKVTSRVVFFPMLFGFAPDPEDALRRVERQYLNDPAFRVKYAGWVFSPLLASICFEIHPSGTAAMIQKNEKDKAAT